jgi:hypothetical protein
MIDAKTKKVFEIVTVEAELHRQSQALGSDHSRENEPDSSDAIGNPDRRYRRRAACRPGNGWFAAYLECGLGPAVLDAQSARSGPSIKPCGAPLTLAETASIGTLTCYTRANKF